MSKDLVMGLSDVEREIAEYRLKCVSPDEGKYGEAAKPLSKFLSAEAEWRACAYMQLVLLKQRAECDLAKQQHIDEVSAALQNISPLNISLLEEKVTKHDQLAVLEEIGRFVSSETKALLHPGTTSFDILDTVRAYLLKGAWKEVMRPKIKEVVGKFCTFAEQHMDVLQVGRTHLQHTSPVPLGVTFAGYAARLAERVSRCDSSFGALRGKVSGIVGTGASVEMVIGKGKALNFQRNVLNEFGLVPDMTATQITQKEQVVDVGNSLVTLMYVLANVAEDVRLWYSSDVGEFTSLDAAARLKGSSADAGKNNPINWENIAGKAAVVESGMRVLYEMMRTNFQRDLRNSVQARYQPGLMMVEVYESFCRASKSLDSLYVLRDAVERNVKRVRDMPTEAMTAILRAQGYAGEGGVGHDVVADFAKEAKKLGVPLISVALKNDGFKRVYDGLSDIQQRILNGELELYLGQSKEVAKGNIQFARML